jgi:D-psicose/D-tagatose/L-ribulose 3-epimerase
MKIGISAFAWTGPFTARHLSLVPKVKEMGFSIFEIAMFDPAELNVQAIRREFAQSGLACTICAILPPGINPIDPDPQARARARQHLARCIETAAELGAHLVGGPVFAPIGYLPGHRPTTDEWQWAGEAFQSITGLLDQAGITLAIEPVNRSETSFLRTAAEAKQLCEAVGHPRVGVTLDTFHANVEEKSLPGAIELLGPLLKHVHASENDRSLLGVGHIDFPAIVEALTRTGYAGDLILEGFGYSPDETQGPGYLWAEQSVSPEELATSGLAYLQTLIRPTP